MRENFSWDSCGWTIRACERYFKQTAQTVPEAESESFG